ncbi:hypothetical protein K438DRAFT_1875980, partial [Mycena galopus ATCC 62051]
MTSVGTEFSRARSRSPRKMSEDAGMGIPRPPSALDLRPKAYPYPIATTATGVFSRTNSLSSPSNQRKQHYVRRAEYRGHRYSCSLSSSEDIEYTGGGSVNAPRALPVPPGVSANSIAALNAAPAGLYSAHAASGATSQNAGPPRSSLHTSTPRALPRRVHGPPRTMSAGA